MEYRILMAMALLMMGSVYAIDLDFNETIVFEFVNATNQTQNETFFCQEFVQEDECPLLDIKLNLEQGEDRIFTQDYCRVDATCQSGGLSETALCSIDKTLEPGETYSKTEGACDIEITVEEFDKDDEDKFFTHTETFEIQKYSSGDLDIIMPQRTFTIQNEAETFTQLYELEFQCPRDLEIEGLDEQEDVLDVCAQYAPFLLNDWIAPTLEACKDEPIKREQQVNECNREKTACLDEKGTLQGEVNSLRGQVNSANDAKNDAVSDMEDAQSSASMWMTISIVLAVFLLITLIMCVGFGIFAFHSRSEAGVSM